MVTIAAWLMLVLVHTPPALATFSPRMRKNLYGVSEDANLAAILTHRGVLFLAVAAACAYAAFDVEGAVWRRSSPASACWGSSLSISEQGCLRADCARSP